MLSTIRQLARDNYGLVSLDALWIRLGRPPVGGMLSTVQVLWAQGAISLRSVDGLGELPKIRVVDVDGGQLGFITVRGS